MHGAISSSAREMHVSLFDSSNAGLDLTDRKALAVHYRPRPARVRWDTLYAVENLFRIVGARDGYR